MPNINMKVSNLIEKINLLTDDIEETINHHHFEKLDEILLSRHQLISELSSIQLEESELTIVRDFLMLTHHRDHGLLEYLKIHSNNMKKSILTVSNIKNYIS
jgi:hypothetical protein